MVIILPTVDRAALTAWSAIVAYFYVDAAYKPTQWPLKGRQEGPAAVLFSSSLGLVPLGPI